MYSPGDLGIASLTPFSRYGDRMGKRGRLAGWSICFVVLVAGGRVRCDVPAMAQFDMKNDGFP